ncbi:MAG: DUF975 family protein [Clostridiales bacterium]|nr:DUF975 family protein [Clostridiales bacterium]
MSNTAVENVYTRHRARELAQRHFWPLLGMFFIAVGIPYLLTWAGTTLLALTNNQVLTGIGRFLLDMVYTLISSSLMLGITTAQLELCRGAVYCPVTSVFSRMRDCRKAFGLSLWVSLKLVLWALPVYAVIRIGAHILIPVAMESRIPLEVAEPILTILPFLALVLVLGLVIPAALRYMLSNYILADDPECSVFSCVNMSKALMAGHKWQLAKLTLPLFLVMLVMALVVAVVFGAIISLLGLKAASPLLSLLLSLLMYLAIAYYSIRMQLCTALFYLKRIGDKKSA